MSNFKLVKTAAAFALGASVVSSAIAVPDASAASKYKLKSGKLVVSKTGKIAKGTVTFGKLVYKNGKKFTGLKGKIYYKAGKKATGTYKGTYYVNGAAKVKTGTYNKAYYVKGKKVVTTGIYKGQYYKLGKKSTGTYKGAYYLNGDKKVTTGYYNKGYYVKGKRVVTTGLYKDTYYVNGKVSKDLALYKDVLYNNGKKNTGLVIFQEKLYDGSVLNKGDKLFEGKLYANESLNKGLKLFESKLYDGAELNKGLKLLDDKLYEDAALSKGVVEFEKKFYNDGVIANGTFVVNGKDEAFEAGVKVNVKVLKAEISENQIKITFNKAIDARAAEAVKSATDKSAAAIDITSAILTNPTLSDDGRTLTVNYTLTNNVKEFTNAVLTVQPLATKADSKESTSKFVQVMNYKDSVAPTVKSVKSETNSTIATTATVELSEEVKAGVQVRINGENVSINPFSGTSKKLELTGLRLETGKTYTLEVVNLEDKVGNKTLSSTTTFTVTVDSSIPTVTSKAGESDREIVLTFSKPMKGDTLSGIVVRDESLGLVNLEGNYFTVVPGTNNTQYSANVNVFELYKNTNTRNFTVVIPKNLEDRLGNRTEETLSKVTLTKDTAAPTIVSSNVIKNLNSQVTSIELNFSEGLSAATLGTAGKNSLNDLAQNIVTSNGVLDKTTFTNFIAKPIKDGDKKVVFEWVGKDNILPPVISGQFTFSFAKGLVSDESATGNQSAAFNHTVNFNTQAASTEFTLEQGVRFNATNNQITVRFNESVRGGGLSSSATDPANYTLSGKALPAGTFIYLVEGKNQQEAIIQLPKGTIEKSDEFAILTVSNITNLAGNKTVKTESRYTTVKDNVDPKLTSARVLADGKTVQLTYNEAVKAKVGDDIKAGFTFTSNNIVTGLNQLKVTSVNGNTVIATADLDNTVVKPAITAPDEGFYTLDSANKAVQYTAVKDDEIKKDVSGTKVTYTYYNKDDVVVKAAVGVVEVKAAEAGFYGVDGKAYKPVSGDKIVKGVVTNTYYLKDGIMKAAESSIDKAGSLDLSKIITIETIATNIVTDLEGNAQAEKNKVTALK